MTFCKCKSTPCTRSSPKTPDEKKDGILHSATLLFARLGYKDTDVQQIADDLEIGKGTIYRHFLTKKDLFLATVDRAMEKLEEFIEKRIGKPEDDILTIKHSIKAYIEFFRLYPEFVELFVQERSEFRTRESSSYLSHRAKRDFKWRAVFHRLHEQGRLRCSNVDLVIDTITNLLYGIMFTKLFQANTSSLEDLADSILDVISHGIFIDLPNTVTS
jgi:AcrR family transcriptional regulator